MNSLNQKLMTSEKIKILNVICTSRSDFHELNSIHWKKARILNWVYLFIVFITIIISFLPLLYLSNEDEIRVIRTPWMAAINFIVCIILMLDYIFRWITYPTRIKFNSINPLFFYFFTATSFLMLLSILSSIMFVIISTMPNYNVDLVKTTKALSILKIFRIILLLNIIPSFKILTEIFIKNRMIVFNLLLAIFLMVFILALIIFSVEFEKNKKINSYGDALYYSLITVTTVGFGDIVCETKEGKFLSILLALLGSVALSIPFGIVVVAFNAKLRDKYKKYDDIDIYGTTIFEKGFTKLFNKKLKGNTQKNNNSKIVVTIENYQYTHENELLLTKIKKFLGGDDNIEKINFNKNNELEFYLYDKTKISNDLNLVINLLEIKVTIK